MSISVLLVDDQPLLRTGLRMLFGATEDIRVVAEAQDGRDALRKAEQSRPDVVLMDIRMPGTDGVEATRLVTQSVPETRVLVLTTFDLDEYAFATLRAGASGFLLKDVPPDELCNAVRAVARGDAVVSPRITRTLLDRYAHALPEPTEPREPESPLTPREREVLEEIAAGHTNAEIAAGLGMSEATVKTHVTRILAKLELRDRVSAVIWAYQHGLADPR
jgi:DNA-binding NarL/FixJ family response regulator